MLLRGPTLVKRGGPGSGNFGHSGRPGRRGGSSTKEGYVTRQKAMDALGVKHASRMNQYFKFGMPSVKDGRSRFVKWPEAKTWYDTYVAEGKGKKGVVAANAAVGEKKKIPEVRLSAPPTAIVSPSRGSSTEHLNIEVSGTKEKVARKALGRLPQSHLATLRGVEEMSNAEAVRRHPHLRGGGLEGFQAGGTIGVIKGKWSESTVTHEAGHAVHLALRGRGMGGSELGSRMANFKRDRQIKKFSAEVDAGSRKAVTNYAKVNELEWFAETYENYVLNPRKLKRADAEAYGFMRDIFGGVEYDE